MRVRSTVLVLCLLAGCDSSPSAPEFGATNNIVISRADGSGIVFAPRVYAWCGPWEAGEVNEPTVHVLVGDQTARWEFRAVLRDVRLGEALSFPNTFIWDQPRGAEMFVHDPPNEASTQTSSSSGAVIVEQLDCSPGGGIRFTVEAVAGSEYAGLPPVTISGHFSSPWTARPGG